MNLISLLVTIIIFALIVSIAFWAFNQVPLAQPFRGIVAVLTALILILLLLQFTGHGMFLR